MKHIYIVFDNDTPLFAFPNSAQADGFIAQEREKLERRYRLQWPNSKDEADLRLAAHFLHHQLVPFAPAARSGGANASNERPKESSNG